MIFPTSHFNANATPATRRGRRVVSLTALATLFTLLNVPKPLHMDDAAYYCFAEHIAHTPLDPYGFPIFWYQEPQPANTVLAPPVLPYWWAAAIQLFGERPWLWKLWLWPFSFLFVVALRMLFRRFARSLETPLLWMTVLSPTFLPSLNLMLDVPALALALGALALFFRASDRGSWELAALAGLTAGLAMQTKYTAFLAPVTMLLYTLAPRCMAPGASLSLVGKKVTLWLLAAACAALVFTPWEVLIAWRYPQQGGSHFLFHFADNEEPLIHKLAFWLMPLPAFVGSVASIGAILGMTALGCRRRVIALSSVAMGLGYAAIAVVGVTFTMRLDASRKIFGWPTPVVGSFSLEQVIFTIFGIVVIATTVVAARQLLRLSVGRWRWRLRGLNWFLIAWLALEVAGYFALTPFGAVRRIMGLVVVGMLLLGRLAAHTYRQRRRRLLIYGVAAANIILGFGFYGVDFCEALARKQAAEGAAAYIRQCDKQANIWYVGHWGFQFYARGAGMQPVVPGQSHLQAGDWLVVPDRSVVRQGIEIDTGHVELVHTLRVRNFLPVKTVWGFYGSATGAALQHHQGPRVQVAIYRVRAQYVPEGKEEDYTAHTTFSARDNR